MVDEQTSIYWLHQASTVWYVVKCAGDSVSLWLSVKPITPHPWWERLKLRRLRVNLMHAKINIIRKEVVFLFSSVYWNEMDLLKEAKPRHSSCSFFLLCLHIIDSQRRRLLPLLFANRLLRPCFQKDGSRWRDEIHVTFGWPLLHKDTVHQLFPVIIPCFYAKGLFVSFVAFSVEHRAFELDFKLRFFKYLSG